MTGDQHAYSYRLCDTQREGGRVINWLLRDCGKAARFFEPKEQSDA